MLKFGLLIVCHNRPQYLQECFNHLYESQMPDGMKILIIDDASTDPEIVPAIQNFKTIICDKNPSIDCEGITNLSNLKIRECLRFGIEKLFEVGCDIVANLDGDAIIKPEGLKRIFDLKCRFPNNIVSGFNCIRHGNVNIHEYDDYCVKAFVGGINTCFNKELYQKYIEPNLLKEGNWDYNTSILCRGDNKQFMVTRPSVVQHIGKISSMGHGHNEDADVSYDY